MKLLRAALAETRESAVMAVTAIAAHKLRSGLTLLGVLVGVFSIIVVMTGMRVMQSNIERELSSLGGETFMVRKWPGTFFGVSNGDYEKYWRRKNVTMSDGKRLMEKISVPANIGIEAIFWSGEIKTRYKTSAPMVRMYGETPGSFPAHNWNLAEGRLFMDADVDGSRNVCVLGSGLATNIFPNSSAVGEKIRVDGVDYSVAGVLESRGGAAGGDQDNFVVVPLSTCLNHYGRWWRSLNILVQAPDRASFDATEEEVRAIMRVIRKVPPGKEEDFEIASNNSMIDQFKKFTQSVRIGVAVVSSIALLAAGIGIMNIMLVSVTERTREIGIRRAIGAKKRNIMVQFILEA
ncbi:MAG: ABC transporter permease, partial [Verrucomicrobiae bacterium]|nr:ABC transporter permease [Verrucomicrobiae bacterium]